MDEIVEQVFRVSYFSGYRERTVSYLEERGIPFVPAKGNKNSMLVDLSPERADELKGLEGIMSVLRMFENEE